jgi:predicted polyphosphate/ATP-dependent NAD kinase
LSGAVVGIVANPVSARDIRRVIAHAGALQITDRANIVLRILTGLAAAGVTDVVMMPENAGIRGHLARAMTRAVNAGEARFPHLTFLDMAVAGDSSDSARAARMMRQMGVGAIVVLGGDGTHRVVVSECGDVPIAGVSSGTNNAFPEMREPTVTGLAVGLAVTGAAPASVAFAQNKRLDVSINGRREIALVDVAIVRERFVGTRAIWKADGFRELFVSFGEPGSIGMSSIVGLIAPVKRNEPFGRRVLLAPPGEAPFTLQAPIAPGLIEPIGVVEVGAIPFDKPLRLSIGAGSIALDGEREIVFSEKDAVAVTLRAAAFRTVDVAACMAHASSKGRFVSPAEGKPSRNIFREDEHVGSVSAR